MHGATILVVDDEADIRELVRALLERAGAEVHVTADGREALRVLHDLKPDVIVLDVTMPGFDGWQTLERVRELSDVPVLMLTGHDQEIEKVRGLRAGADDYVTKPFGREELLARVDALLRRGVKREQGAERELYDDGLVAIDPANAGVTVNGAPIALTPLEFRLLNVLVRHPDQVLNREQLLELVWGDDAAVGDEQVKLYVGYLRRKLEPALGDSPSPVETVRGFGYRYRRPV